jgi:hypothetical protein
MTNTTYQLGTVAVTEIRRWGSLSPAKWLETMLNARELAVGLIRGQVSKRYPDLSSPPLNLKVLQEIERRDKQYIPRFQSLLYHSPNVGSDSGTIHAP